MITTVRHRPCPVCAGEKVEALHHQRFILTDGHPLPPSFDISSCAHCGFVYADTAGDEAAYDRYYRDYSKYADQATSTGGGGDALDTQRLFETAEAIAACVPDRHARIVDIGCANGGLLSALRELGFENLCGIDPSPRCVENTVQLFGIAAEQGWLGALPPSAANADVLIVSHVLEHVLDLKHSLAKLSAAIKPAGLVYCEVPDASRYWECLVAPYQDFNTEHINHFSQNTLNHLFAVGGFERVANGTKTLVGAGTTPYPALFGFYRPSTAAPSAALQRDEDFLGAIRKYIAASAAMLEAIDVKLTLVLNDEIIVWGAGQLTLKLLAETRLGQARIAAIVDSNPVHHGRTLRGIPVIPPSQLSQIPPHPIILGTFLHHHAIMQQIRAMGSVENPIITLL